jgi:tRNA A37 threonylcarbamoyladenosine modification protein TsaB
MIINNNIKYHITHENSKINYEKITLLIDKFLSSKDLNLSKISKIYVNRGPGSFAGIRNSLSTVKAIHLVNKIDYYCFSFNDFDQENEGKYENIPDLCKKFKVKKNLINPIYLS